MNPGRPDPDRPGPGRADPGRIHPDRIDPDLDRSDRGSGDDDPSDATFTRRLSWPTAALMIGALSLLGWGLIGLATRAFWR